jgi:hypothetical protein
MWAGTIPFERFVHNWPRIHSRVNTGNRITDIVRIRGKVRFHSHKSNSNFTLARELETQETQEKQNSYVIDSAVVRKQANALVRG